MLTTASALNPSIGPMLYTFMDLEDPVDSEVTQCEAVAGVSTVFKRAGTSAPEVCKYILSIWALPRYL